MVLFNFTSVTALPAGHGRASEFMANERVDGICSKRAKGQPGPKTILAHGRPAFAVAIPVRPYEPRFGFPSARHPRKSLVIQPRRLLVCGVDLTARRNSQGRRSGFYG